MPIEIVPYAPEHEAAVEALNQRIAAAGGEWAFYRRARPLWLPPGLSQETWRDYFLAIDESGLVRAAYCLRAQRFESPAGTLFASSIQGPVSEGAVNPRFGALAMFLLRDMETRSPRLYTWGPSGRLAALLRRLRWREFHTPSLIRLVRPSRVLRRAPFLRRSWPARTLSDIAALSGFADLGIGLAQWGRAQRSNADGDEITIRRHDRFGGWADRIWGEAKSGYDLIAVRDAATMNAVLPEEGWPQALILSMRRGDETVGWAAVRDTHLVGDARLGDLRLGSVIDSLARPGEEAAVARGASRFLEQRGVDLILANYTHRTWIEAFGRAGFLASRPRRPLLASPALSGAMGAGPSLLPGVHMTALDADGPHGL